jgi:hypothetical protein
VRHPFHGGGLYPIHSHCFGYSTRRRVAELTDAAVEFEVIPHDHWYQPDWIDDLWTYVQVSPTQRLEPDPTFPQVTYRK